MRYRCSAVPDHHSRKPDSSALLVLNPDGGDEPWPARQIVSRHDLFEKRCGTQQLDGLLRRRVVVLDSEATAGKEPTRREFDDCGDHGHAVGTTEQRMVWIMVGYFGIQHR